MSCERYTAAIVDHACGAELDAEAAAHVRTCASCLQLLDEQQLAIANLDRELEQMLAIDPSPRFAPQVLARVRQPSRWRRAAWWGLPLAAAAALLLVVFGSLRSGERTTMEGESVSAAPNGATPPVIDSQPATVAVPPTAVEHARVNRSRRPEPRAIAAKKPAEPAVPEVIVPAEASRALARYVELVRRGAIDTSTLAEPARSGAEAPTDLVIAPLAVDAISVMDVERRSGPGGDERDRGLR